MPFRSLIPALVTPFNADLSVAPELLETHVRFLLGHDIEDVVVCGTMGEAGALTDPERELVIRTALGAGARVTVGVSSPDAGTAARRAESAEALGAAGVMCLPPTTYPADDRELEAHFEAVANATDLPMILYNNPNASSQDIPAETITAIAARHEQIVAVKECSGNARRIAHLVELARDDLGHPRRRRRLGSRRLRGGRGGMDLPESPTSPRSNALRSRPRCLRASSTEPKR